jgi:hypothetical protein
MANFNNESYHSLIGFLTLGYLGFLKLQVVPRFTGKQLDRVTSLISLDGIIRLDKLGCNLISLIQSWYTDNIPISNNIPTYDLLEQLIRNMSAIISTRPVTMLGNWENSGRFITEYVKSLQCSIKIRANFQLPPRKVSTPYSYVTSQFTTVNKLFHTCWQLAKSSANTTCWRSVGSLVRLSELFASVHEINREISRIAPQPMP